MLNFKFQKAYSLIEILVVLGIFAVLATLATQAVVLTLRSAKKSESSIKIKENLTYSLAVMERQLRNATVITAPCNGSKVDYTDSLGNPTYFKYMINGPDKFIASGSATTRLTSSEVIVSSASFTCSANLTSVTINLTGTSATATGVENTTESVSTTVFLRQSN